MLNINLIEIYTQKDIKVSINNINTIIEIIKTNKYFYTFSVIETFALIGISIWQFYYMRNLFEFKGSL